MVTIAKDRADINEENMLLKRDLGMLENNLRDKNSYLKELSHENTTQQSKLEVRFWWSNFIVRIK